MWHRDGGNKRILGPDEAWEEPALGEFCLPPLSHKVWGEHDSVCTACLVGGVGVVEPSQAVLNCKFHCPSVFLSGLVVKK